MEFTGQPTAPVEPGPALLSDNGPGFLSGRWRVPKSQVHGLISIPRPTASGTIAQPRLQSTEGHDGVRALGEGATGEMAWALGVDGRSADGLQSPHRPPKALCGSCDARDGERIRSRGLSRDCGDVGSVADRECRAKALGFPRPAPGEMRGRAERVSVPPDPPPEGLGDHGPLALCAIAVDRQPGQAPDGMWFSPTPYLRSQEGVLDLAWRR